MSFWHGDCHCKDGRHRVRRRHSDCDHDWDWDKECCGGDGFDFDCDETGGAPHRRPAFAHIGPLYPPRDSALPSTFSR